MTSRFYVAGGFAIAIGLAHAGCSGDDKTVVVVADGGTPDANNTRSDAGGGKNPECAAKPDNVTCTDCCTAANPVASDKLSAIVITCLCQPTNCKEACKDTLCGTVSPEYEDGSPCDLCVKDKNATCTPIVNEQCKSDTTCLPMFDCLIDNDCTAKP